MSSDEVTYTTGHYGNETALLHVWTISDEDGIACQLYANMDRLEIAQIETRTDRQREGLARKVYETALAQMPIVHAPVAHRTFEGAAFAEAVGGDTAEYACDCSGCDANDDEEY